MAPALSILIFSRDDEPLLRRCLEGLRAEPPREPWEVLVFDNASRDGTPGLAAEFADLPLRMRRSEVDTSFSAGNNALLAEARGGSVLFLNPDTEPSGPLLDACLAALRSRPDAGLLSPRLVWPDGSPQATGWHLPTPRQLFAERFGAPREVPAADADPLSEVGWLMGCFLLGPAALLRELGGFDEAFWFHGTDLELCARVRAAGRSVLRLETEQLVHVGHRDWDAPRRASSHAALVQWLRRDHGDVGAGLVQVAARLREGLRA